MGLKVSVDILVHVRNPLEKQLDPKGPIDSQGRFGLPFVKYVDDLEMTTTKHVLRIPIPPPPHPLTEFSGSAHDTNFNI